MTTKLTMRDVPCEMMCGGLTPYEATQCGATPTIGTNGLYRYCEHHMAVVARAGATSLVYDEPKENARG